MAITPIETTNTLAHYGQPNTLNYQHIGHHCHTNNLPCGSFKSDHHNIDTAIWLIKGQPNTQSSTECTKTTLRYQPMRQEPNLRPTTLPEAQTTTRNKTHRLEAQRRTKTRTQPTPRGQATPIYPAFECTLARTDVKKRCIRMEELPG